MSSFLNKITKKDLLTYFEVDEQLLSKDVIDFLDKLLIFMILKHIEKHKEDDIFSMSGKI